MVEEEPYSCKTDSDIFSGEVMDQRDIEFAPKLIYDLLDIIRHAVLIVDHTHHIIFANSHTAEMLRSSEENLIGSHIKRIFTKSDQDVLVSNIIKVTRAEREFESEVMLSRFDDSNFPARLAATFFLWDSGKEGIAFTLHDLSDLKSIENTLRKSERAAFLGRVIDDISHQIRNPVMVIGGFARKLLKKEQNEKWAGAIVNETNRLETLLTVLNKFIKLPNPRLEKIKVINFILRADKVLKNTEAIKDCQLEWKYEKTISDKTILIDPILLLKALEMIVANGCEAYEGLSREKLITIDIKYFSKTSHPFRIKVTDTGCGILENSLEYVTDHFYTNKTNHVGMGLTLARRIIEQQAGAISIDSQTKCGTSVTLFFLDFHPFAGDHRNRQWYGSNLP